MKKLGTLLSLLDDDCWGELYDGCWSCSDQWGTLNYPWSSRNWNNLKHWSHVLHPFSFLGKYLPSDRCKYAEDYSKCQNNRDLWYSFRSQSHYIGLSVCHHPSSPERRYLIFIWQIFWESCEWCGDSETVAIHKRYPYEGVLCVHRNNHGCINCDTDEDWMISH